MKMFNKVKEKVDLHFKLKKDASLARVEGYSRGVDDTTASLTKTRLLESRYYILHIVCGYINISSAAI